MAPTSPEIDRAFESLAAFDWNRPSPADAIFVLMARAHGDAPLRADLEKRLVAVLTADTSPAAKQYACRMLARIGTAASVPALGNLLTAKETSHSARIALERIDAGEAGEALRQALDRVQGELKIGIVGSLAARHDAVCVPALAKLLTGDVPLAVAAADGLGSIGTPEAIAALQRVDAVANGPVGRAVANALLTCAERLLAAGKRTEALKIYETLAAESGVQPQATFVHTAAVRGVVACLDTSSGAT